MINAIIGKGQEGGFFPLLALPLMIQVLGKGVRRAGRGCGNMDQMDKRLLVSLHPLSNIESTKYFNYGPRFNGVFSRVNIPTIKDKSRR